MMGRVARRGLVVALLALVWAGLAGGAAAQGAPHCAPGERARFVLGFAELKEDLDVLAGEPLECEHYDGRGNAYQRTTTGQMVYDRATNTASFTFADAPFSELFAPYTIDGLRERGYPGGQIELRSVLARFPAYTRYYIAYPSDGLTITGVLHLPVGEGPFPVVILNHGYIPQSRYWSGADTWRAADYLARRGYLTLAPDYRGWGGSDEGSTFFRAALAVDVLNLVSSLPSLPQADPTRVGLWGHSMGGGVTTKVITVDDRIDAAVLYAPVTADDEENSRFYSQHRQENPEQYEWRSGGSGRWRYYRELVEDATFMQRTSPINYFRYVETPVQIHQGTDDTVTPPRWADEIRAGLEAAGVPVDFYSYPGDGHAFREASWQRFMQRATTFFDAHLR